MLRVLKVQQVLKVLVPRMLTVLTVITVLTVPRSENVKEWTRNANNVKRSDRTKYAKLVTQAQAIQDLSKSDPDKFRRGYAVLVSAEADGLDTEEALFGAQAAVENDKEQLLWDTHNLRGALKRLLAQAVAEAPTVDFAAPTVQKSASPSS